MKNHGRFFLKLILFLLVATLVQVPLSRFHLTELVLSAMKLAEEGRGTIFLGDSTLYSHYRDDPHVRSTADLLNESVPGLDVGTVAYRAYHSEIFYYYTRFFARAPRAPRLMIIPVNLRAFSMFWTMNPAWQFSDEKFQLSGPWQRVLFRPLASLKALDLVPIEQAEYEAITARHGGETYPRNNVIPNGPPMATYSASGELMDHRDRDYRQNARTYFEIPIPQEERILDILAATADEGRSAGMRTIFYIQPVNIELGELHGVTGLSDTIQGRVARIRSRVEAHGGEVLDLTTALDSGCFSWWIKPLDDHLIARGREAVAAAIKRQIETGQGAHAGRSRSASSGLPADR